MPPAVYMYEPKVYGFKLAGKRGSTYYTPSKGGIQDTATAETELQRKMNPTFASEEFSFANANKNNNNNNRTPQTAVTSQAQAQ